MFKNLIPKIFYDRLQDGLDFFVDGLGFAVLYQDATMAVVARDGAKAGLSGRESRVGGEGPSGAQHRHRRCRYDLRGNVRTRAAAATPELQHRRAQALGLARVRDAGQDHGVRELSRVAGRGVRTRCMLVSVAHQAVHRTFA
ncbi:hypothetical protein [Xanthomonas graminis]|uniref:hypothetical protein n=1 Tax=Xanthomonas graminis TaxID=3390026 RepID=UPI000AE6CC90|nr:hypothetical protein [Xanthomonas translucens]UKE77657.1 hypothetical protein KM317_20035 [Xanthomonas translucens pv. arrhenatheri]